MDAVGTPASHPLRGLDLTSSYSLHAERDTTVTEERWYSAGNDRVTLDYRDVAKLETHVSYDASGAMALSMPADWQGRSKPNLTKSDLPRPRPSEFKVQFAPPPPLPKPDVSTVTKDSNFDGLDPNGNLSEKDRIILMILWRFFGFASGKLLDPKEMQDAQKSGEEATRKIQQTAQPASPQGARQAPPRSSAWMEEGVRRTTEVKEQVEFQAELKARVDDGKGGTVEQSVSVKLRASSEFFQQEEMTVQVGNRPKKDPLVLDLTGTGIDLTGVEDGTVFDLNADGKAERTATVKGGTALLWMDRNGNGQLDKGSELFGDFNGAATGFESLAALDSNGDHRVDSNDAAYGRLRLRQNVNGQAQDQTLAQASVASLELQHVALPASLGDSASVDAIGVFQRTDGSLGTMADVRLAYEA